MAANITLTGYLAADAETRTAGDKTVCGWRLAHNSKGRGNDADDVLWFGVDIWQPWDSHTGAKKGDLVTVIGDLSSRVHKDKQYLTVNASPWNAVSSVRRDKPAADSKPSQGKGGW